MKHCVASPSFSLKFLTEKEEEADDGGEIIDSEKVMYKPYFEGEEMVLSDEIPLPKSLKQNLSSPP